MAQVSRNPAGAQSSRYAHHCRVCVYLGRRGKADLYFHRDADFPNVVARLSSIPRDYRAGLHLAYGQDRLLTEARTRAERAGLYVFDFSLALHHTPIDSLPEVHLELVERLLATDLARAYASFILEPAVGAPRLRAWYRSQLDALADRRPELSEDERSGLVRTDLAYALAWLQKYGLVDERTNGGQPELPGTSTSH